MSSSIHSLKHYITAAWISLWAVFSPIEQLQAQTVMEVSSLLYCKQDINLSEISQDYTIRSGDTFSALSSRLGMPYSDFVMIWNFINPWKDINGKIKVGDHFLIPKYDEASQAKIELYKTQIIAQNNFDEANRLFTEGNIKELELKYSFEITPKLPVWIGISESMKALIHEFSRLPIAYGPRTVLPEYQTETICANLSRSMTRDSTNLEDPTLPDDIEKMLRDLNIDAWHFHDRFTEVGYISKSDLRSYFGNLRKSSNPIPLEKRGEYKDKLLSLMGYLKEFWKPDTKIPVLFLHTGALGSILSYKNGKNPSSHVFSYVGEWLQNPYRADFYYTDDNLLPQYLKEFWESKTFDEYLIDIIQMRSGWGFSNTQEYRSIIRENIEKYEVFVEVYVDGKKVDILREFSGKASLKIHPETIIQLWGSIIYDGIHVKTAVDTDLQENMNMRLMLLWEAFAVDAYFPAEILEAPQDFLNYGIGGSAGTFLQRIPIIDVSYLKEKEDVQEHMFQLIAKNKFGKDAYNQLTSQEQEVAKREFDAQRMAHQLYGNLSLDGTQWNDGSTRVNRWFYYFDTTDIEEVYAAYIAEKKQQYYKALELNCSLWETQRPLFVQVIFFPGDTTADILTQLQYHIRARSSETAHMLWDFDRIQKNTLLKNIFGSEISSGNLQVGKVQFIDYASLEWQVKKIAAQEYLSLPVNISDEDSDILDILTHTNSLRGIMEFLLLNESYINKRWENLWNIDEFLWIEELQKYASRKNLKRIYRWLAENNMLSYFAQGQDFLSTKYDEEIPTWVEKILSLPTQWPRSYGDFQLRFDNLSDPNLAFTQWPTLENLREAVSLISDPNSPFAQILTEKDRKFPVQFAHDRFLVEEIEKELQQENPDARKISDWLQSLFQLNDETNSLIIGKIISASLLSSKILDHSEKVIGQLERSGEDIFSLPDGKDRIARMILLANNEWEGDELRAMFDNFLYRYFSSLPWEAWNGLPIFQQSSGISSKIVLNEAVFYEHIEIYLEKIDDSSLPVSVSFALEKIADGKWDTTQEIYDFMKNSNIQEFYTAQWLDISLLPTVEELNDRNSSFHQVFSYADSYYLKDRVVEAERKISDFRGVFLGVILGWYIATSGIGWAWSIVYKNTIVPVGRGLWIVGAWMLRFLWNRRKKRKEKKFFATFEKGYRDPRMKQYIEKLWNKEELVFTNEVWHPAATQYQDGQYSFSDAVSGIIADHNKKIVRELIRKEKKKIPLLLLPEQRVDRTRYAIAAAE